MLVAASADGAVGAVHPLPQVAAGAVGHEGEVGGCRQREEPSVEATACGLLVCRRADGRGQTLEVALVGEVQRPVVEVGQGVLAEAQLQLAELLLVALVLLAFGRRQRHAVAAEALEGVVEEGLLLRRQRWNR